MVKHVYCCVQESSHKDWIYLLSQWANGCWITWLLGSCDKSWRRMGNTLKCLLIRSKDETQTEKQRGLVYNIKCNGYEIEYNEETARTLVVRFKEHTVDMHPNSTITKHTSTMGHKYTLANKTVLVKKDSEVKRKVTEAITIHKKKSSLSRDRGHKTCPPPSSAFIMWP